MKNREKLLQKQSSVALAAVFCCLLWGSAFPGIKAGYVSVTQVRWQMKPWRYLWT